MLPDLYAALQRFALNLPARPIDALVVRAHLGEILEPDWKPADGAIHIAGISHILPLGIHFEESETWGARLRAWLSSTENVTGSATTSCPLNHDQCPWGDGPKGHDADAPSQHAKSAEQEADADEPADQVFHFLAVGGGPAGSGGKRFLDLARKTTKGCKGQDIRQVIVTDPYISASTDEHGDHGDGYTWFCRLLFESLGLNPESEFELFLHPAASEALRIRLGQAFKSTSIKSFQVQGGRIHDRFYLVRGKDSRLHGVFGPSLNGLSGKGVFLMGDLEPSPLAQLDQLLHCP